MSRNHPGIKLSRSLHAWGSPAFKEIFKDETEQLDPRSLPLQQGLAQSSYVSDGKFSIVILMVSEEADVIRVKAGIFFTGLVPGCNCADDPSAANEMMEHCEVQFDINKGTAETGVTLLPE